MSDTAGKRKTNTPTPEERAAYRKLHLGWHPQGGWCRKFPGDRNRTYFGRVSAAEAIEKMRAEEQRRAGILPPEPPPPADLTNLTVSDAANIFLNQADRDLAEGRMSVEQRASYGQELQHFVQSPRGSAIVGPDRPLADLCAMTAPDRFFRRLREQAVARGLAAAHKHIVQVRRFLDWCSKTRRFMPPPFYADQFDPPGAKEIRAHKKATRRQKGTAYWEPAEVRQIVDAAEKIGVHFHAQVLLMLNGGMGATDLSELDDADVDWDRRCIHTDRSKTLVPRVVPLWDRTIEALRKSRAVRPEPADPAHATRFFLTRKGKPLVWRAINPQGRTRTKGTDAVRNQFQRLFSSAQRKRWKKKAVRLPHLRRHGAGAYTLRAVFFTLAAGQPSDLVAIIAGHKLPEKVREHYLRGELLRKLRHVTSHVHAQLWPESPGQESTASTRPS